MRGFAPTTALCVTRHFSNYSVLGCLGALCYMTAIVVPQILFEKKRSFASGIGSMGKFNNIENNSKILFQ